VPVMLSGEPGTGKTWVARVIHGLTAEADDGFAVIDCGRLPSPIVVELLFGAKSPLKLLQNGTIYLRDPNRLARDVQVQLARWLEEHAAEGPRFLIGCQVEEATENRFPPLDDQLIGIIDALQINLPPLRDQRPDMPKFVERMLHRINSLRSTPIVGLSDQAAEYFRAYRWPGNLRELYAALQTSSARTDKNYIDVNHLPAPIRLAVRMQEQPAHETERKLALDAVLQEAERRLIVAALRKARGNRTKAAELLSIWRARLVRRMEALGIEG
jgi:DNA-binding NtrC family response regulator